VDPIAGTGDSVEKSGGSAGDRFRVKTGRCFGDVPIVPIEPISAWRTIGCAEETAPGLELLGRSDRGHDA